MATQIPERIADLPEPPYKGVDLGAVFVSKAEGFRYELSDDRSYCSSFLC